MVVAFVLWVECWGEEGRGYGCGEEIWPLGEIGKGLRWRLLGDAVSAAAARGCGSGGGRKSVATSSHFSQRNRGCRDLRMFLGSIYASYQTYYENLSLLSVQQGALFQALEQPNSSDMKLSTEISAEHILVQVIAHVESIEKVAHKRIVVEISRIVWVELTIEGIFIPRL